MTRNHCGLPLRRLWFTVGIRRTSHRLRRWTVLADSVLIFGGDAESVRSQRLQSIDRQLRVGNGRLINRLPFALRHRVAALQLVSGNRRVAFVRRKLVPHRAAGTQNVADFWSRRCARNSYNRSKNGRVSLVACEVRLTTCKREADMICPAPARAARCGPAPAHSRLACGAQRALLPVAGGAMCHCAIDQ